MGGEQPPRAPDRPPLDGVRPHPRHRVPGQEEGHRLQGHLHGAGPGGARAPSDGAVHAGRRVGTAAELPPESGLPGRAADDGAGDGERARGLPRVGHHGGAPALPHQPPADIHQVHQRATAGHQGGPQADVRRHLAGPAGDLEPGAVEADALRPRLPAHNRAGAPQVRAAGLEHPVRVQPVRLHGHHAVLPEPPGRYGPEEGRVLEHDPLHDRGGAVRRPRDGRLRQETAQHLLQVLVRGAHVPAQLPLLQGLHHPRVQDGGRVRRVDRPASTAGHPRGVRAAQERGHHVPEQHGQGGEWILINYWIS